MNPNTGPLEAAYTYWLCSGVNARDKSDRPEPGLHHLGLQALYATIGLFAQSKLLSLTRLARQSLQAVMSHVVRLFRRRTLARQDISG